MNSRWHRFRCWMLLGILMVAESGLLAGKLHAAETPQALTQQEKDWLAAGQFLMKFK